MTTIAADLDTGPTSARHAVSSTSRRRGTTFSEVRQARLQHGLQVAAVATGLVSVTVAASAAILLGVSA